MTTQDLLIADNTAEGRYEARLGDVLVGLVEYETGPDLVVYTHSEVSVEGLGIGGRLARRALDDARTQGRQVLPVCPFIKSWIDKHPDYADLVVEETA